MNKDKLTPQQIGKVLFETLKLSAKNNYRTINRLMRITDDPKPKVSLFHIKEELLCLDIYITCQAIWSRFKSSYNEIEKSFKNELAEFLKEKAPEEFVLKDRLKALNTITYYMEQHNNTIAKSRNGSGLNQFSHYIAKRVLGESAGDDMRYIMFMGSLYTTRLTALLELIDKSIDLEKEIDKK